MRPTLHPRVPAALLTALAVCGCALGQAPTAPKAGPVSYQTKVQKVNAMTKTFSLSKNVGLGQVASSLKDLTLSLQSAFIQGPSQGVQAITSTGLRASYELAGISEQGNATLTFDDKTKELTGVKSPDAELAFKFLNKGRTRSWEITIVRCKDGTTGTLTVEVTGGWTSQQSGGGMFAPAPVAMPAMPTCPWTPEPYPSYGYYPTPQPTMWGNYPTAEPSYGYYPSPSPYGSYYPSYAPSYYPSYYPSYAASYYPSPKPTYYAPSPTPTPRSSYAPTPTPRPASPSPVAYSLNSTQPMMYYTPPPCDNQTYDDQPMQEWTPPPPPPFKVFGGEYPNVVEAVNVKLDIKPRGDAKLAIKLDGQFNEPEAYPGGSFLVPTHWVVKASVPKVAFDWESHLHLDPGKSSFKGGGSLTADTAEGAEKFLYDLSFDEAAKTGAFGLTNVAGKVRLQVVGSMMSSKPDASLVSTEDGKHLGKVEFDPARPRFATVKLDDGTDLDWELFPADLFPTPALPAPPPTLE
ncbi:MAG: hypothetical protein JWM80_6354 [Cyanobacteria bacterium RYN_339]|nr:hypothetical protein [Cyanobacteria bacterium RYN_339]